MTREFLPSGTVTYLISDLERSTLLWERFPDQMRPALKRHDSLIESLVAQHGGTVVRPRGEGDSRFCVFARATDAVLAAAAIQRALHGEPWPAELPLRARVGIHTGEDDLREGDYYGSAVNRCARIKGLGHGGQILVSQTTVDLVRDRLPEGLAFADLGSYALRYVSRPERVYQLNVPGLPTEFPPLLGHEAKPHNLPAQLTQLVGRTAEVGAVIGQVRRPDVRLLTLTGTGGIGKTRLALAAAAELVDEFEHGAFFVDLSAIADHRHVAAAIAGTLGIVDLEGPRLVDGLKDYLHRKRMLLVLDNFEQVLEAAPLLNELLVAATDLKILVTSRAALRVTGERVFPVPVLRVPAGEDTRHAERVMEYEAVRLFVDRAVSAKPDFTVTDENAPVVAEICGRLDGLPLAIELAAARVRLLPPAALLGRLERRLTLLVGGARDVPARQQTLRDAIRWSYDLLDATERRLFRTLAVFAGGCTLEAAEAVCRATGVPTDILEGIASLVDKSLVRQVDGGGTARFIMLPTLREYGMEQLEHAGERDTAQRAHAACFLALAEEAAPHFRTTARRAWLDRLDVELDNFRAALAWGLESDPPHALRLSGALHRFWMYGDHFGEGRRWVDAALARTGPTECSPDRARALLVAGQLAQDLGDAPEAIRRGAESVAMYRALGDKAGLAYALQSLMRAYQQVDDLAAALGPAQEAERLFRELGDRWGLGYLLTAARPTLIAAGIDPAPRLQECLEIFRELGDPWGLWRVLGAKAREATERRDFASACGLYDEALTMVRRTGQKRPLFLTLVRAGDAALAAGDYAAAEAAYQEATALAHQVGLPLYSLPAALALVALREGDVGRAARRIKEHLASLARDTLSHDGAMLLLATAALGNTGPHAAGAARLLAAIPRLLEPAGAKLDVAVEAEYERTVANSRARLGTSAWAAAADDAETMTLDQAIDLARQLASSQGAN